MGLKFVCFLILGIFACNKVNQWKQPTKVCFNVGIEDVAAVEGKLLFSTGYLTIESFNFDGKRDEGADVSFTKIYENSLNAPLGERVAEGLSFDIPQGVYASINVEVLSKSDNLPNLVVNGSFEKNDGTRSPVRFEFSETETFSIAGENLAGNDAGIDLAESLKTNATIWLNPAKWFDGVSAAALNKAQMVSVEGKNTILINHTTNQQLYNSVVAVLNKEVQKAIFIREG